MMAQATGGYSFAYQALGYLCFRSSLPWEAVIPEYDAVLEEFVYEKAWSELSPMDRTVLYSMASGESERVQDIRNNADINSSEFSVYRNRLIKKGLVYAQSYGRLDFTLPRFREFVLRQHMQAGY